MVSFGKRRFGISKDSVHLDQVYGLSITTSAFIQGSGTPLYLGFFKKFISPQNSLACRILIDFFFIFFPNTDEVLKYYT